MWWNIGWFRGLLRPLGRPAGPVVYSTHRALRLALESLLGVRLTTPRSEEYGANAVVPIGTLVIYRISQPPIALIPNLAEGYYLVMKQVRVSEWVVTSVYNGACEKHVDSNEFVNQFRNLLGYRGA